MMRSVPERMIQPEILDLSSEGYGLDELEEALADLRVVNRRLGDTRAVIGHLSRLAMQVPHPVTVLDIATGSADIPVALAEWGRRSGVPLAITAVDNNMQTLGVARRVTERFPEITLARADGLLLPFASGGFDIVLCCKTLHHFSSEREAVRLLQEVLRVARRGYLVMDLRRSRIAWLLIALLTRLFTKNRITRNDGPLSVLRSFTPGELAALAREAGASSFRIDRELFWLMLLKGEVS